MNKIPVEIKLKAVQNLFNRDNLAQLAQERFKNKFPHASDNIIHTLAFHLYIDGHDALLDMLYNLEMFLVGETDDIDYGRISHVVYHLYNFQLLESIMPETAQDISDDIQDIITELKDGHPDVRDVIKWLEELKEKVEGNSAPPESF